MNNTPAISVVIPLYNKSAYVEEAVRSVLAQSYPAVEVLVVDDGSTDGSADLVRHLAAPSVRVITQPNAGVSAARNTGIKQAHGDYLAFLDADDRYLPGYLAAMVTLIQRYPEALLYCAGYTRVWPDGRRLRQGLPYAREREALLVEDFYAAWRKGAFTSSSSIAMPRAIFSNASMCFPPGEKLGEDQDMWFRIAERGDVAYINEALVDYRMEVADSATQASVVRDVLPCYRRLGERLAAREVPSRLRRSARRLLASHVLNVGRARFQAGDVKGAWQLTTDARASGNPLYRLRTIFSLIFGRRVGR